jgi:hypothetical protein
VRKYRCKPQQVKFNTERQLKLLKTAKLKPLDEDTMGETDGLEIRLNSEASFAWDRLVSTLVHEFLHNYCLVRGRYMSCENEHKCMLGLGEP